MQSAILIYFRRRYHKSDLEELAAVSSIMRQAEEAEERFARWNDGQRVKVEQNNQVSENSEVLLLLSPLERERTNFLKMLEFKNIC